MIRATWRRTATQPQPRRRRLRLMLLTGVVLWFVSLGELIALTFWPGRSLAARMFSGAVLLTVVGISAAFAFTIVRLERSGAFDQDAPWT